MQGRKPVPTKLKLLTGNPGKRKISKTEPEPPKGITDVPKWLLAFPVAVEEWNREAEILDGMGVLTVADSAILATRCYLSAQIQELAADIAKEGRVAYTMRMDALGNEVYDARANPKCIQIKNLITEYRQIGSLLGFDPASRTKLSVEPEKKKSKFSGLVGSVGTKQ